MDRNLYIRYVILLIIGCIGAVVSIVLAIYIYTKEELNEYINLKFLWKFISKKKFADQSSVAKSNQLAIKAERSLQSMELRSDDTDLLSDDTDLLSDDTDLLSDEFINK